MNAKIIYILSQFPEIHETFILREIVALRERGIKVKILSLKPCRDKLIHPQAQEFIKDTVYGRLSVLSIVYWVLRRPVKTIDTLLYVVKTYRKSPKDLVKALYVLFESLYFINIIKKEKITHIHSHWATMPTTAAMILNKLTGTPFSFTAHAWDIFVNCNGLEEKVKQARFVITCTDYNRKFLSHLCRNEESRKIYLNYHGVDIRTQGQSPSGTVPFAKSLKILAIGRLVETKGFEYLIDACRILRDKGIGFECQIVGSGSLEKSLRLQVANLKLQDKVRFLGLKTQNEIKELFQGATVLVQPSIMARNGDRDGIPNVILEAMALGTPVISTNFSGIPEAVVDKQTGVLVPEKDSLALADAIENLWKNVSLKEKLVKNSRELVEKKFDVEKNTEDLIRIFQENGIIKSISRSARISILYVIWSLGLGGGERTVIYLAKRLDKDKFNPIVCCLNDKGIFAEELERDGIQVIALNKKGKFDISVVNKLINIMRQNQIEIVHTHMWGGNLWGRIAAKIAKVPVIIATEQNVDVWKKPYHLILDRWLSFYTDRVIAVSNGVKEFYTKNAKLNPEKIKVIYNSVDLEKYNSCAGNKRRFDLKDGGITLGVIGRLVPQKGHRYFLLALKELLEDYRVRGLVIGTGPLENELKQFSQELGLNGNVIFTGLRHDIPELLKTIDILILPSLIEGLPLVALEAMASGVPVVATKVGGSPEIIIDSQTGILIEPRNHIAIKEAVTRLIHDEKLVQQLIRNSRKCVEDKFSAKKVVQDTQCLYEELYKGKVKH